MNEPELIEEQKIWDALCEDPLYPCAKCTGCQNPRSCHSKTCLKWRSWWMVRFLQAKEALTLNKKGNKNG